VSLLVTVGCHAPAQPAVPHDASVPEAVLGRLAADWATACNSGSKPEACLVLSGLFSRGTLGFTRNEARADDFARLAMAQLQAACDAGDSERCALLGAMFVEGTDKLADGEPELARRVALAMPPLEKGCRGGEADACERAGMFTEEGRGMASDPRRAAELYARGCAAKHEGSCGRLGILLANGAEGLPADGARAAESLARACAKNDIWCARLGALYRYGRGVPRDAPRALLLYKRACAAGDAWGCAELGSVDGW
jgi:TPR repeat protein